MRALLDVNVLIALFDSDHVHHERARSWLESELRHGWASCAITQNGFVRIISQPAYPNGITPHEAITLLADAAATEHHEFWTCSVSLVDGAVIDRSQVHGHRQVTDAYLLALAVANEGRLVTFDAVVALSAVRGATNNHLVIV